MYIWSVTERATLFLSSTSLRIIYIMYRVMKCSHILQNMVVKEKDSRDCKDGDEITNGSVVGQGNLLM